jgi:hypothetical protein
VKSPLSLVLFASALGAALGGCQIIAGLRSLDYAPDGSLPDGARPDGALPGVDVGVCTASGWCWIHPRPVGVDLMGLTTIAGELWVVGNATTTLRGDGVGPWAWEPLGTHIAETYLVSVAGTGSKDVWIAGRDGAYHYDGLWVRADIQNTSQAYNAIAVSAQGRTWLVGNEVFTAPANGAFSRVPENASCLGPSSGVVAGTADDAWIVGGRWLKHATPSTTECIVAVADPLYGVYVAPDGTRFVVGGTEPPDPRGPASGVGRARIEAAAAQEFQVGATLYAVHGSSSANVWAVGRAGMVLQFDGGKWIDRSLPQRTRHLYGVHVVSPQRVVAVGERGLVATWNGSEWTVSPEPTLTETHGLFSRSALGAPPDVWVLAGEALWHFDGKKLERTPAGLGAGLTGRDISGTAADDVWIGVSDGTLRHYDGKTWSVAQGFTESRVDRVYAPRAGEVWVASGTKVHRWDGKHQTTFPIAAPYDFPAALWVSAAATAEAWVVLESGHSSALFRSADSGGFTEVQPPTLAAGEWITSVSGAPGTNEVWITTSDSRLFRRDGAGWKEFAAGGANARWLAQTADTLWATGDGGQPIARYLGNGQWDIVKLPSDRTVWGVTGGVGVTWIGLEGGGLLASAR